MTRLAHAWRALEREQRHAALASLGLFVSMFLPWYSRTNTFVDHGLAKAAQTSSSAFQAFSFVEAAVLLVSAGVLGLLFARVEQRPFQLPGGDGLIVMIAGGWAAVLIFVRLLDKPGLQGNQRITATVGVQWGIFIALLLALGLLYAGARMRAGERPEPPLARARGGGRPGEPDPHRRGPDARATFREPLAEQELTPAVPAPTRPGRVTPAPARPPMPARPAASTPAPAARRSASGRPRYPPSPAEQMSFEDPPQRAD
jgi:hypothetical protein